ncbi:MAG: SH3 domain-containing protein, partial [Pseudomonadota bacterium]
AEAIAALAQCDKRWPALAESCDVAALTDFSESCDGSTFHRRAVLRLRGVKLGMLCPATGTDTGTATASAPATEALEGPGPGAALPAPPAETPAETPAESPSAAEPAAAPPERRQADPDPAPEPEPAFDVRPASGPLYVTRASNVRLGPGTRYERVATLPAGRRIQMTGESPNGWKRFELDGRTVFIAGSLVRATPPAAAAPAADPAPARVTTARTQTPARRTQPEPAEEALRDGFRWESEGSTTPAVSAADALRARQETEAAATPTPAATQASQTPAPAQTVASQAEPEPEETWTPFGANSGGGSGGGGGGGAN